MNQAAIFRLLVVASLVLAILGECLDWLAPGLIPPALEEAYDAHMAAEEPTLLHALALGGLALVLFIGGVAGSIGLLLFKPWARPLSLWVSVVALPAYPLMGPLIYSGWAYMLTETGMTLWGAVLAMAYFSDVKVRFQKGVAENALQATHA